jgi:transcriptional regulator with XRE-family HTH domain
MSPRNENLSPFAAWLLQLAADRKMTLTAVAHRAGLAPGTLRYLVLEPERKPTLETCLRLSAFAGQSVDELLMIANQRSPQPIDPYHPDRLKIVSIFDALPVAGRRVLLEVAELVAGYTVGNQSGGESE